MKRLLLTSIIAAVLTAPGCAYYEGAVKPPRALITWYKAPVTTDFDATPVGTKVGQASTGYIRIPTPWLDMDFAWDKADIAAAARNGGITTVTYVDHEYVSILGLIGKYTTIVHGD